MWKYVLDVLLVAMAVSMFLAGRYGVTRQLAFAPLLVAAVDAAFAAQVDVALTPVLSALLVMLQVVIFSGSALVLYEDRVHARNKAARRRRRREVARSRLAFEQAAQRRGQAARRVCA